MSLHAHRYILVPRPVQRGIGPDRVVQVLPYYRGESGKPSHSTDQFQWSHFWFIQAIKISRYLISVLSGKTLALSWTSSTNPHWGRRVSFKWIRGERTAEEREVNVTKSPKAPACPHKFFAASHLQMPEDAFDLLYFSSNFYLEALKKFSQVIWFPEFVPNLPNSFQWNLKENLLFWQSQNKCSCVKVLDDISSETLYSFHSKIKT